MERSYSLMSWLICANLLTIASPSFAQTSRPMGFRGEFSQLEVLGKGELQKVAAATQASSATDVNVEQMAAKAMHYLIHNPLPQKHYECRFDIDLLKLPPSMGPGSRDPYIAFGDTESRMDCAFIYMRDMCGSQEGQHVEEAIRNRIMGYIRNDGLCWLPPYAINCDLSDHTPCAINWTTDKVVMVLAERYARHHDQADLVRAAKLIGGLKGLASWDAERAYYPGGLGGWRDGKWMLTGCSDCYPCILEPIVRYLEQTNDPAVRKFAESFADGLIAGIQKNLGANRIRDDGSFAGYNCHLHMRAVLGVARLGLLTKNARYLDWSRKVYDWLITQGTDWGWFPEGPGAANSETCATGDMTAIAACLASAGRTRYWDDVERFVRNYCRQAQFFVTPKYEAFYRQVHKDDPNVGEGLRLVRDFEGGFVARLTPNSLTIGPTMNMMGCCPPEAMRAIHVAWQNVVRESNEGVFVNLRLNHDAPQARVISFGLTSGQMTVVAKKNAHYFLRPPCWTPREQLTAYRGGVATKPTWKGDYIAFENVKSGEELAIVYPVLRFRQSIDAGGKRYAYQWVGNTVLAVDPPGEGLPLFQETLK
jgi:hypothetical protein